MRRQCAPLALCLLLAGCATQPATDSADRMELARQAYLTQDYERAFALTRAEAELGNPRAQYVLGYMYYNGEGVLPDPELALKWIRAAASRGDAKAVEALSRLAELGTRSTAGKPEQSTADMPPPGAVLPAEQTPPAGAPTEGPQAR